MKFSLISDWFTDFLHDQFKQFSTRSGYALGVSGLSLFFMSLLSWKLLVAIALGIAIALGVYESQQPDARWIQHGRKTAQRLWSNPLGKAALSGSGATFILLTGFGLTSVTGRGWIAATLILQSAIALGVGALWQQSKRAPRIAPIQPPTLDRYINDLAHPSLMRRMIAVRRLQNILLTQSLSHAERHELQDYFQILLTRESDAVIRLAVQDALAICDRQSPNRAIRGASDLEDFTTVQVRNVTPDSRTPSFSTVNL